LPVCEYVSNPDATKSAVESVARNHVVKFRLETVINSHGSELSELINQ
jgi:hypothetical protein